MADAIRFPIKINKKHGYFEDQNGTPFFWHADTCWRIFWMLSYEDACLYLDDRARKGFSVIQVHMLPHHVYQKNVYGENPFKEEGKINLLNEAYFCNVDRIISYAEKLGIAIAIAPMWLSTWEDDWHMLYHGQPVYTYSKEIATRYGRYPNVIAFIHGGDDDAIPLHDEVNICASIYKKYAPHVLNTFHAGIGPSYSMFGNQNWYDFCMNYTYNYDECIRQMREAKSLYPQKPALLGETHYDGNDGIAPITIRRYAYTSAIMGGAGHTYGNKDIWMANMFFFDALYSAASHHMVVLREIFECIPWYKMQPDFEGKLLHTIRALMPGASDGYIPSAITADKDELIAYVSDCRYFAITAEGEYVGEWIDPVSGRTFHLKGKSGDRLNILGHNAEGTNDWVLHVKFARVK